ncbi:MAG: cell division protein FtsB [Stagnimonas sp.]|nr:cell division protein FtsB [Stagnimonas sp.]
MRRIVLWGLLVMVLFLQYRLWLGDGGYADKRRMQSQVLAQQAEVEKLRARNAALQAEVDDLKSGVAAVEGRARSELGMIFPGETFYLTTNKP